MTGTMLMIGFTPNIVVPIVVLIVVNLYHRLDHCPDRHRTPMTDAGCDDRLLACPMKKTHINPEAPPSTVLCPPPTVSYHGERKQDAGMTDKAVIEWLIGKVCAAGALAREDWDGCPFIAAGAGCVRKYGPGPRCKAMGRPAG